MQDELPARLGLNCEETARANREADRSGREQPRVIADREKRELEVDDTGDASLQLHRLVREPRPHDRNAGRRMSKRIDLDETSDDDERVLDSGTGGR